MRKIIFTVSLGFMLMPFLASASVPTHVGVSTIQRTSFEREFPEITWCNETDEFGDPADEADWNNEEFQDNNGYWYAHLSAAAASESLYTEHDTDCNNNTPFDGYREPVLLPTDQEGFNLWSIQNKPMNSGTVDVFWRDSAGAAYTCSNITTQEEQYSFGGETYYLVKIGCPLVDSNNEGFLERIAAMNGDSGSSMDLYALIYTAGDLFEINTANEMQEYMDMFFGVVVDASDGDPTDPTVQYGQIDHIVEPTWGTVTSSSTVEFGFTYTYNQAGTIVEGFDIRTWPGPGIFVDTYEENETFASGGGDSLLNVPIDLSAYSGERLMWQPYIKDPDNGQKIIVGPWTLFDVLSTPEHLEPLYPFPVDDQDFGSATSSIKGLGTWFSGLPDQLLQKHPFAWFVDLYDIFVDLRQDSSLDQPLIEFNFDEMGLSSSTEEVMGDNPIRLVAFSSSTVMAMMPSAVFGALRALISAVLWVSLAFMMFDRIKRIV